MSDVTVTAILAHDAYAPGDAYGATPDRARALAAAGLVPPVDNVKGARRGTRKAGPGESEQDDPGSVAQGAGDSSASGDEPRESAGTR